MRRKRLKGFYLPHLYQQNNDLTNKM